MCTDSEHVSLDALERQLWENELVAPDRGERLNRRAHGTELCVDFEPHDLAAIHVALSHKSPDLRQDLRSLFRVVRDHFDALLHPRVERGALRHEDDRTVVALRDEVDAVVEARHDLTRADVDLGVLGHADDRCSPLALEDLSERDAFVLTVHREDADELGATDCFGEVDVERHLQVHPLGRLEKSDRHSVVGCAVADRCAEVRVQEIAQLRRPFAAVHDAFEEHFEKGAEVLDVDTRRRHGHRNC